MGCYADNIPRDLRLNGNGDTIEACVQSCQNLGCLYAGMQNGLSIKQNAIEKIYIYLIL